MNENLFTEDWEEAKLKLKLVWNKLTDYDLEAIECNQDEVYQKLHDHYGYTPEQTRTMLKIL